MTPAPTPPCRYPWCVTAHGASAHPDDEVHRSAGTAIHVVRAAQTPAAGTEDLPPVDDEWEVGLVRPLSGDRTWLVIDAQERTVLRLSTESARRLATAIRAEASLAE